MPSAAGSPRIDDLFVVAHGWNNDLDEARALYRGLFGNVRRTLDEGGAPALAGRKIAVLGVLWPSKSFAEKDLIRGRRREPRWRRRGPRRAAPARRAQGHLRSAGRGGARAGQAARARARAEPSAQRRFVDLIRSVLPRPKDTADDASDTFFELPGDADPASARAADPARGRPVGGGGGGAGGIGLTEAPGPRPMGGRRRHRRLLQRHRRGGGSAPQLRHLLSDEGARGAGRHARAAIRCCARSARPIQTSARPSGRSQLRRPGGDRGGARAAPAARSIAPASMTLLQAAFSHNAFAARLRRRA